MQVAVHLKRFLSDIGKPLRQVDGSETLVVERAGADAADSLGESDIPRDSRTVGAKQGKGVVANFGHRVVKVFILIIHGLRDYK